uniref:Uncharacterized protein n=1 Tax=Pogona vitticeps TaxID=103695 RepID=A0ABM5GMV3_9SAUR
MLPPGLSPSVLRPKVRGVSPIALLPRKPDIFFDSTITLAHHPTPHIHLAPFLRNWSAFTADKWVLDIIQFWYRLEFLELPPLGCIKHTTFQSSLTNGNLLSTSKTCCGTNPPRVRHRRFLLQILRHPQKRWGHSSYLRSPDTKPLPTHKKVLHGHNRNHTSSASSGRLVHHHRPPRRLFSYFYSSSSPQVSAFLFSRHRLSVLRHSLRLTYRPLHIYKVHGPSRHISSHAQHKRLPVYRQLVNRGGLSRKRSSQHCIRPRNPQITKTSSKQVKVPPPPFAGHGIHRHFNQFYHSTYHPNSSAHIQDPPVLTSQDSISPSCPAPPQPYGLYHCGFSARATENEILTSMVSHIVQPTNKRSTQTPQGDTRTLATTSMVDFCSSSPRRSLIPTTSAHSPSDNRRQPCRLGCQLRRPQHSCPLVTQGTKASHQSARDVGSHKGCSSLSSTSTRTSHPSGYRQYDHDALHKQTRRHLLPSTSLPGSSPVGILLHQSHIPSGSPRSNCRQPIGGCTQPFNYTDPRMGTRSIGLPPNLPKVEDPTHRYVRN